VHAGHQFDRRVAAPMIIPSGFTRDELVACADREVRQRFGVLAHIAPMPKPCGYCSHPSIDNGRCGICQAVIE
jgi:hypothetical protein